MVDTENIKNDLDDKSDFISENESDPVAQALSEKIENEELISTIVSEEWAMFQGVNNIGGRASCQDDPLTFRIMRKSQYSAMPEDMLRMVLENINAAKAAGRNLLTEKYAYMMRYNDEEYFDYIKGVLPEISKEKEELIKEIAEISINYHEEIRREIPGLAEGGRPLYSIMDSYQRVTSVETYLKGELMTYTEPMLRRYLEIIKEKNPLYREYRTMAIEMLKLNQ